MLRGFILCSSLGALLAAVPAWADDPCLGFKWDVRQEHALFAGDAAPIAAGNSVQSAPQLRVGRLYALTLSRQSDVAFAAAPGRSLPADGSYAGLAALQFEDAGNYRIALDLGAWIDVAADGKLAPVVDFQGQRICDSPHKIVEFELRGAEHYVLQVSGAGTRVLHVTLTKAPPRT